MGLSSSSNEFCNQHIKHNLKFTHNLNTHRDYFSIQEFMELKSFSDKLFYLYSFAPYFKKGLDFLKQNPNIKETVSETVYINQCNEKIDNFCGFLQRDLDYTSNENKKELISLDEFFSHYCFLESFEARRNPFINSYSLKRILFSAFSDELIVQFYQKMQDKNLNEDIQDVYKEIWMDETEFKNKIQLTPLLVATLEVEDLNILFNKKALKKVETSFAQMKNLRRTFYGSDYFLISNNLGNFDVALLVQILNKIEKVMDDDVKHCVINYLLQHNFKHCNYKELEKMGFQTQNLSMLDGLSNGDLISDVKNIATSFSQFCLNYFNQYEQEENKNQLPNSFYLFKSLNKQDYDIIDFNVVKNTFFAQTNISKEDVLKMTLDNVQKIVNNVNVESLSYAYDKVKPLITDENKTQIQLIFEKKFMDNFNFFLNNIDNVEKIYFKRVEFCGKIMDKQILIDCAKQLLVKIKPYIDNFNQYSEEDYFNFQNHFGYFFNHFMDILKHQKIETKTFDLKDLNVMAIIFDCVDRNFFYRIQDEEEKVKQLKELAKKEKEKKALQKQFSQFKKALFANIKD